MKISSSSVELDAMQINPSKEFHRINLHQGASPFWHRKSRRWDWHMKSMKTSSYSAGLNACHETKQVWRYSLEVVTFFMVVYTFRVMDTCKPLLQIAHHFCRIYRLGEANHFWHRKGNAMQQNQPKRIHLSWIPSHNKISPKAWEQHPPQPGLGVPCNKTSLKNVTEVGDLHHGGVHIQGDEHIHQFCRTCD